MAVGSALGVAALSLLGAGGDIAGAFIQADAQKSAARQSKKAAKLAQNAPTSLTTPQRDPALAAATFENLLQLGISDPEILRLGFSPKEAALARLERDITIGRPIKLAAADAIESIFRGQGIPNRLASNPLGVALNKILQIDVQDQQQINELLARQREFDQRNAEFSQQFGPIAERFRASRNEALLNLADSLASFEPATGLAIDEETARQRAIIERGLNDAEERLLSIAANTGGNVGSALENLSEFRAVNLDDAATTAALGLLGQRQGLQAQGLGNIATALNLATDRASALGESRAGLGASAAQIAGSQASALANLANQSRLAGAGFTAGAGQALGQGISAATSNLQRSAQFQQLLQQLNTSETGGVGGSGGNAGLGAALGAFFS